KVLPSRSAGRVISALSARTAIPVAQCCSGARTATVREPAALAMVDVACVEIPNSALPASTRVSGVALLYGRISTSRPASANRPSCCATYRPVWLVLGVQSNANRMVSLPESDEHPTTAESAATRVISPARVRRAFTAPAGDGSMWGQARSYRDIPSSALPDQVRRV